MFKFSSFFFLFFSLTLVQGQLCNGSFGEPVFVEDFGVHDGGDNYGNPLSGNASTTYNYRFTPNLSDGDYTIAFRANHGRPEWHNSADATNDPMGQEGNMLVVNASFNPGEFYRRTVTGLCDLNGATYRFSAKVLNALPATNSFCGPNSIPVNVRFDVLDLAGNVLLSQSTGNIPSTVTPSWQEFTFDFQLSSTQSDIVLVLRNNGVGGCGNDLAIDDISFRLCGEVMTIAPSQPIFDGTTCASDAVTLTANIGANNFLTPEFQWQSSTDNGATWQDIACTTQDCVINSLTNQTQYRFLVNESGDTNPNCFLVSSVSTVDLGEFTIPEACGPITVFSDEATADFDLTELETHFGNGLNPNELTFSYYQEESQAIAGTNAITNPSQFNSAGGTVFVRVENGSSNCFATESIHLILRPIETFVTCDSDSEGGTIINLQELRQFVNENVLEIQNLDTTLFMSRSMGGIVRLTNPTSSQVYDVICGNLPNVSSYNELAINNNQEVFLIGTASGQQTLMRVNIDNCTWVQEADLSGVGTIIAGSMDTNNNLLIGTFSSEVLRATPNDYGNLQSWHDFGSGRPAGDFIELNNRIYISWLQTNGSEVLFDVEIDANKNYVSHTVLGSIPNETFGMAADLGRLFGVTPTQVYEVGLSPFQTDLVFDNPSNSNTNRWFGAAGLREADTDWTLHRNLPDAQSGNNPILEDFNIAEADQVIYYIRYFSSCYDSPQVYPIRLRVTPRPVIELPDLEICLEEEVLVDSNLSASEYRFEWLRNSTVIAGETNSSLALNEVGDYRLVVTQIASECSFSYDFVVTEAELSLNRYELIENQLTVFPFNTDWMYVLNNGTPQSGNVFTELTAATHNVQAAVATCRGNSLETELVEHSAFRVCGTITGEVIWQELETHIRAGYDLDLTDFALSLHADLNQARTNTDPITTNFQANEQTYFYRLENELGSFIIQPIRIEIEQNSAPQTGITDLNFCPGEFLFADSGLLASEYSFIWSLEGELLTGESNPILNINAAGNYNLQIRRINGSCTFNFPFTVSSNQPLLERYDLIENNLSLFPDNPNWEYTLDGNSFQNQSVFTSIPTGIYGATPRNGECLGELMPVEYVEVNPLVVCGNSPSRIDFEEIDAHIREAYTQDVAGFSLSIHETLFEATSTSVGIQQSFVSNGGPLYYRLTNAMGIRIVQPIEIQILENPTPILEQDPFFCVDDPDSVAVLNSGLSDTTLEYIWTLNGDQLQETTPQIEVREPGLYSLTVRNPTTGCIGTASTEVAGYQVVITDINTQDNVVVITATGERPLTYSLTPNDFQSSPIFESLPAGTYNFVARDRFGCVSPSQSTTVLFIPNFISPNGDGRNDVWDLSGIENLGLGKIQIYDRYGKQVYGTTTESYVPWDGTYLGRNLPSATYWYVIDFREGEAEPLTGSVTIKR